MLDESRHGRAPLRWRAPLVLALLFAFAVGWFQVMSPAPPDEFAVDEAEWIAASIHAWQLATTGESVDVGATEAELRAAAERPWRLGIEESTFGWMNPVLAKFAFGFAAERAGMKNTTRRIYPRFHPDGIGRPKADANRARARFLPALGAVRLMASIVAAGVGVLAFAAVWSAAGPAAATFAYLLWLASPTAQAVAVYVRTGLFPLLFGLAALLVVIHRGRELVGARGVGRMVVWALALGVLCGCAVGSKLNGALVSFVVPLWLNFAWFALPRGERPTPLLALGSLATTGAVCAALFWATLPGLWGDPPVAAVGELLSAWDDFHLFMVRHLGPDAAVPGGFADRFGLSFQRTIFGNEPGFQLTGLATGLVGVPLGLAALLVCSRRGGTAAAQLYAYVVVVALGTALWVPLDRPRFFEPFVLLAILVQASAIGLGVRLWRQSRADRSRAAAQ